MSTITGSYARSFWRSSASSWAAGISSRASSACAAPTSICCRFRVRVAGSARRATRKRATLRRTTGGDRPTTLFHVDDPQDAAPVFSISSRAHQGTVPHRPPPPGRTSAPYARATRVHDGRHILRQRLRLIANAKQ